MKIFAVVVALLLLPAMGHAFPQSTETSGEIATDLNGTWLVVNRLEFTRPSPSPQASPSPGAAGGAKAEAPKTGLRPFTVANLFTITHVPTVEAQKIRETDKKMRQASIAKATKILAEEQEKAAKAPQPAASGTTPVEPKVMGFGIPRAPESVVDMHDEVSIQLLDVVMPKEIQEKIDEANKAEKPWEPTAKDLELLKSSYKTLKPPARSEYNRIQWKVVQDKYLDTGMTQDPKTKDSKFVISGDATLFATPGQANRNIIIYGADKVSNGTIEGGHVRAIMTAAPFPIPIDMKGVFKMIRLTTPPKPPAKKDA
jgi:hypothetical protein